MPDDIDRINEIFRIFDERADAAQDTPEELPAQELPEELPEEMSQEQPEDVPAVSSPVEDATGRTRPAEEAEPASPAEKPKARKNATPAPKKAKKEDREKEPGKERKKESKPPRRNYEYRSGCLGGLMYFVFIICVSVVLACVAWMAASDVLALNKESFTATVELPSNIFTSETVDVLDEDGNKTGTERVTSADMDYVAKQLHDAGLIQYEWLFKAFSRIAHADTKVSPGEYELRSSFDYGALIRHMRAGSSSALTVDVTLPEGFSMYQIFKRLEENGVCSFDDLMESAANDSFNYENFLSGVEPGNAADLEGYLFPDTYQFYVDMQPSSAINKFLQTFNNRFTADMLTQTQSQGMTVKEIVTIASLIEKEAANDEERPIIASVIYNRMNADMPLGIDASILYVHPEHEGAPTAEMLEEDSPYNTRMYAGLPPTPICNPGMASINAALAPATTDYYYYALDTATGTHMFFTNSADHEAFVATQNYE